MKKSLSSPSSAKTKGKAKPVSKATAKASPDGVLLERADKIVTKDNGTVLKIFGPSYKVSAILNEAMNEARAAETGLPVAKVLEVLKIRNLHRLQSGFLLRLLFLKILYELNGFRIGIQFFPVVIIQLLRIIRFIQNIGNADAFYQQHGRPAGVPAFLIEIADPFLHGFILLIRVFFRGLQILSGLDQFIFFFYDLAVQKIDRGDRGNQLRIVFVDLRQQVVFLHFQIVDRFLYILQFRIGLRLLLLQISNVIRRIGADAQDLRCNEERCNSGSRNSLPFRNQNKPPSRQK